MLATVFVVLPLGFSACAGAETQAPAFAPEATAPSAEEPTQSEEEPEAITIAAGAVKG
ncbi:MAG TPA: hypothetical protein VFZ76_08550 [Anaerolineales bacterium]